MGTESAIIEDMKRLGLSEYEAKAYLKLLEQYPVNGYALSKSSSIPRSRIYEVLDSLKNKQIVFEQTDGKNTVYRPLDPQLLVNRLKSDFNTILNGIDDYTKKLYAAEQDDNKLTLVNGRENILNLLKLLIADAKKRIAVSIWEEEIGDLSPVLDHAIGRGVMLKGIYFGKNNRYSQLVTHRRIERYLAEKKERYMTVIIDGIHVVSGVISRDSESQVTWTKDIGLVEMSEDYISHDLSVNLYSNHLDPAGRAIFEDFLDNVRKDYYGFTEEEFINFKNKYVESIEE